MFETVSTRMHTLDIGEPPPGAQLYDRKSGWALVASVEQWLGTLRRFQALAAEALNALATGTMPERDAVAERFAGAMGMIEEALPTMTFDMDVRTAIGVAAKAAYDAEEQPLYVRLLQLHAEVAAIEAWLTERLGAMGEAPAPEVVLEE